jgi:hypothetical protein
MRNSYHDHTSNLFKTIAKQEKHIIKKHATLPKTRNKATVNEVAQNILSSSYPNTLSSMSISGGAIKMAVYREKTAYYKYRYSFLPHQHCGWLHMYDSQFMDQPHGAGGHDSLHF